MRKTEAKNRTARAEYFSLAYSNIHIPENISSEKLREEPTIRRLMSVTVWSWLLSRKLISLYQSRRAFYEHLMSYILIQAHHIKQSDLILRNVTSSTPLFSFCRLLCRQILRQWQSDSWHLFYHLIKVLFVRRCRFYLSDDRYPSIISFHSC